MNYWGVGVAEFRQASQCVYKHFFSLVDQTPGVEAKHQRDSLPYTYIECL